LKGDKGGVGAPGPQVLKNLFQGVEHRVRDYELFSTDMEWAFTHALPNLDHAI